MLTFKPLTSLKRGQLFEMLASSYQDLADKYDPKNKEKYIKSWQQADSDAFDNPKTIGKCILITHLGNEPIGFFPLRSSEFSRIRNYRTKLYFA